MEAQDNIPVIGSGEPFAAAAHGELVDRLMAKIADLEASLQHTCASSIESPSKQRIAALHTPEAVLLPDQEASAAPQQHDHQHQQLLATLGDPDCGPPLGGRQVWLASVPGWLARTGGNTAAAAAAAVPAAGQVPSPANVCAVNRTTEGCRPQQQPQQPQQQPPPPQQQQQQQQPQQGWRNSLRTYCR
jgi:hypothetical protein